jgi:hypothetical protein
MRVLVYVEDVIGIHYATNLELAVDHLCKGDEVHFAVCHGSLQSCPANDDHDWKICMLCRSKLRAGLAVDEMARATIHVLDLERHGSDIRVPVFNSIDELKEFTIGGVNHGMEAASSVISALRDPRPDMEIHRQLVQRCCFTSVALFRTMLALIDEIQPDACYVLNGRRASQMPAVRAIRSRAIKLFTFEVGHVRTKYILIEGTFFHDLDKKKREIDLFWENDVTREQKEAIAHGFFHDRRYGSGDEYLEAAYKKNQHRGRLPTGFDPRKRNIAIYNSSEDEFAAVEGYANPVYKDQIDGLQRILNSAAVNPDLRFYLRVHPNLGDVTNYQTRAIENLRHDNLVVIGAREDIDSYALMEASEKVVTFGSAMSIESAYAKKPSILIGRESYEDLGSCYTPRSHEAAMKLINDPTLPALSNVGALKFGYYVVARDREYRIFDPKSNTFEGRALVPSATSRRTVMMLRLGLLNTLRLVKDRLASRVRSSVREMTWR